MDTRGRTESKLDFSNKLKVCWSVTAAQLSSRRSYNIHKSFHIYVYKIIDSC